MEPDPLRACTPEQLVKFSTDKTAEPDKEFRYNNANYILLGMLIEKVTNNSLSNQKKKPSGLNLYWKEFLRKLDCKPHCLPVVQACAVRRAAEHFR
jgi:hypothetical protein